MKKTIFTLLTFTMAILSFGQNNYNNQLIKLGKSYKDYMFRNEPNKEFLKELKAKRSGSTLNYAGFVSLTFKWRSFAN